MAQSNDDHHKNFAMLYAKNCAEIGVIANHTFLELLTQEDALMATIVMSRCCVWITQVYMIRISCASQSAYGMSER